jgi:hypothetical protein
MPPKSSSKKKIKSKAIVDSDVDDYAPRKSARAKVAVDSDVEAEAEVFDNDEPTARFVLGFLHVIVELMFIFF